MNIFPQSAVTRPYKEQRQVQCVMQLPRKDHNHEAQSSRGFD